MLGAFAHPAFLVVWMASTCGLIGIAMYDTAAGWLMTTFGLDPFEVALLARGDHAADFPVHPSRGRDRRHHRSTADDHRRLLRHRRADGGFRRRGGARLRLATRIAAHDIRAQRGLVPQHSGLAVDLAAPRAEAAGSRRHRRPQRQLQSQPHGGSDARRLRHRGARGGRAILDFRRRQSGGDRGAHLVARATEASRVTARRKIEQRAAHRPSARSQQPPPLGDPRADDSHLSVHRGLLGSFAFDRPANRPRRRALRPPVERDQRRSGSRVPRA